MRTENESKKTYAYKPVCKQFTQFFFYLQWLKSVFVAVIFAYFNTELERLIGADVFKTNHVLKD